MNYIINHRTYTATKNLEDMGFQANKNYLFPLNYLGLIKLHGPKAGELLQGQLSCDLRDLTQETMRSGLLCNLKGRIEAIMDLILLKEDYHLLLPRDLIRPTLHSLHRTALLARVNIEEDHDKAIFGFYLTNPADLYPDFFPRELASHDLHNQEGFITYAKRDKVYVLIVPKKQAHTLTHHFTTRGQLLGSLDWHRLQLEAGDIEIYPESRGLFLPHDLDLHKKGYLNFNKGCYRGQEIIARMHYRANLKHGLKLFSLNTKETLRITAKLYAKPGESPVGELIDFCPIGKEQYLIAASILKEHPACLFIEEIEEAVELCPWQENTSFS